MTQAINHRTESNQSHFGPTAELQSPNDILSRLSEQEEDDDDGADDDDEEEVVDNVSKNTLSSTFTCYSGRGDSNVSSRATDSTRASSLRKRNVATSATPVRKANKSKCVHFMPSPKQTSAHQPVIHSPAEFNSRPLKRIVFNGTYPIDDPYSSRF